MYDTTIAAKLLGQLESFWGRISPHFHKPVARFIGDMVYGIMIEKDVKLSSIVRALKEKITPKKSRTGSAGCSRLTGSRRGCTASLPQRAPERSTRTRSITSIPTAWRRRMSDIASP